MKKKLGSFAFTSLYEGLEGISLKVFQYGLGWTPEEIQVLLVDVRKDLKNPKVHTVIN